MCVLFPDEIRLYCAVFTFTDNDIESTFNTRCNNGCLLLIDGMVGASDSWDFWYTVDAADTVPSTEAGPV